MSRNVKRNVKPGSIPSAREVQVLTLVAKGLSNAEIGRELYLEVDTVKTHMYRIGQRLGCGDRAGMVAIAYCTGLLRIPTAELMRQATELVRQQRSAA